MRILYFSHSYTPHDHRFLSALSNFGHIVFFLTLTSTAYETRFLPPNVTAIPWPTKPPQLDDLQQLKKSLPALQTIIKDVRPDLIQAGPVQTCGYLTALSNFHPFCLVSWGSDILIDADRDRDWQAVTRNALKQADLFLCDCQAVRLKAKTIHPIPDNAIIQFPWGIDTHLFSPGQSALSLRQDNNWANACVILSLRSWEPIYGIDTVLESFYLAQQKVPQLRLLLLGDGSLAPKVNAFIQNQDLSSVIACPGRVTNTHLPDYYRACNLYLSCAHSDGSSISLLEAMGVGLPPIVTDAPGNNEWIKKNKGGWLAPIGDANAFAKNLIEAAQMSQSERHEIITYNRETVENRANWTQNIHQLHQQFEKKVGHNRHT